MRPVYRRFVPGWETRYQLGLSILAPLNALLAVLLRGRVFRNSVLHISYMVHIPFDTTRLLREHGMKADYLAIGTSSLWDRCDYQKIDAAGPLARAWQEFVLLWRVLARYEILHLHFMITASRDGWELVYLRRMKRRVVVHYRGCEIRNRERNMALHPEVNLCQDCDYNASICRDPLNHRRREWTRRYGDAFLVTTPDLWDFAPDAEHLPFIAPDVAAAPYAGRKPVFRIVHVTGHPGLEGTNRIAQAIDRLRAKGHAIDFVFLKGVPHEQALAAHRNADVSIGKMKMGYYANAQVESLAFGVPAITHVRPQYVTPEIEDSGLILAELGSLEATIERCMVDPEFLARKRAKAHESALRLHGRDRIARRLIAVYDRVRQ
jgi:hypothetical protein